MIIALALSTILAAPAPIPLPDAPAAWRPAVERAQEAGRAFQKALQARLAEAISQGGPPAAIDACATDAGRIAAEVAASSGTKLGRTSERLRNPANAPPDWTRAPLEGASGKKGPEVVPLAVDLGGKVGVLLPIVIGSACLGCHGPAATLQPKVKEALAARYPADRAVGYSVGDFRGFLWVESAK